MCNHSSPAVDVPKGFPQQHGQLVVPVQKIKTQGLFKETTTFFCRILYHKLCFHSHACMAHVDKKYASVIDHTYNVFKCTHTKVPIFYLPMYLQYGKSFCCFGNF